MLKNHRVHSNTIEKLCDDPTSVLPQAKYKTHLYPKQNGYIRSIDGMGIAQLGLSLKSRESVLEILLILLLVSNYVLYLENTYDKITLGYYSSQ